MENIVVNISANADQLKSTIDTLVKLEIITAKDAEAFKKLSSETQKTSKSFQEFGQKGEKGMKQASGGVGELKKTFLDLIPTITAALAVERLIRFGVESVKAFRDAELNAKKLQTALIDIGGEGEQAFKKLIEQSKKLQSISVFSDDDIQKAQTQLSQFGLMSGEIEKIIPKILDLASAQGIELGQATDIVIQGINGVTRGLKPLGLEFVNTGDKAQNFAIISEKLNKFQGQTAAVLKTSGGEAKNLANQFNDLQETIGGFIQSTGIITLFSDAIKTLINSFTSISDLRRANISEAVKQNVAAIKTEIDAAIKSGKTFEQAVLDQENRLATAFKARKEERAKAAEEENTTELNRITGLQNALKLEKEALDIIKEESKLRAEKTKLGLTEEEIAKRAAEALAQEKKELEDLGKSVIKPLIANFQKLSEEQINVISLLNKMGDAFKAGDFREFSNDMREASIELGKMPDKIQDTSDATKRLTPEIEILTDEFLDLRNALAKIFPDQDFTTKQIQFISDSLRDFGEQAKEIFLDVFDNISAGFLANAEQFEQEKERRLEGFDEEEERLQELNNNKILSDGLYAQKQKELAKQREATEKELNKKIADEKRKAFIADRNASLIRVAINTAESITRTSANLGFPFAIPFIAIAAALGILQAATIASQPIPKFKKGVIGLKGHGTETSDSIPAMLSRGESVMTAAETKRFEPTLLAIRKNLISPEILNSVSMNHTFGKVEAYMDTGKLTRANRKIIPHQADAIGKSVAHYINESNYYSPLRN